MCVTASKCNACRERHAFVPALVASGLPNEKFCFEGFLPQKKGRMSRLKALAEERRTMVFYESPHRLVKALTQFTEHFGAERQASVSRGNLKDARRNGAWNAYRID
mgnify:CR=1 FL=1